MTFGGSATGTEAQILVPGLAGISTVIVPRMRWIRSDMLTSPGPATILDIPHVESRASIPNLKLDFAAFPSRCTSKCFSSLYFAAFFKAPRKLDRAAAFFSEAPLFPVIRLRKSYKYKRLVCPLVASVKSKAPVPESTPCQGNVGERR